MYKVYLAPIPLVSLEEPSVWYLGKIPKPTDFKAIYKIKNKYYRLITICDKEKYSLAFKVSYKSEMKKRNKTLSCPVCKSYLSTTTNN